MSARITRLAFLKAGLVGDDRVDTELFRHIGGAYRDGLNAEIGEAQNERRMQDRLVDQQRDDVAGAEPLRTRMRATL